MIMINALDFLKCLGDNEFEFFTGVPDSLLKDMCTCISRTLPSDRHITAANEGNAVSIACGYNIATGKTGVVYMQNSGLGNAINPLLSLADEKVYNIPLLIIVGYRGEPNVKDEPQHIKQGELTLPLLETLGLEYIILSEDYRNQIVYCKEYIEMHNKPIVIVVRKSTFARYEGESDKRNHNICTREKALELVLNNLSENDFVISTTGKTSREIYEIRERNGMGHGQDFLTVGSMGHTSSLALGISRFATHNIYCVDGDGAFLMHMGGLAVAARNMGTNYRYILINNGCHESVGGQPTIAYDINIKDILYAFGFEYVVSADCETEITDGIKFLKEKAKSALIINTNDRSRSNLGRPGTTPESNKNTFIEKLRK